MRDLFDALAHPVRRKILSLLRKKPMSAGDIAEQFHLTKPSLSAHFAMLKEAGLISAERRGTTILYRLNMTVMDEAVVALIDIAHSKKDKAAWVLARS